MTKQSCLPFSRRYSLSPDSKSPSLSLEEVDIRQIQYSLSSKSGMREGQKNKVIYVGYQTMPECDLEEVLVPVHPSSSLPRNRAYQTLLYTMCMQTGRHKIMFENLWSILIHSCCKTLFEKLLGMLIFILKLSKHGSKRLNNMNKVTVQQKM